MDHQFVAACIGGRIVSIGTAAGAGSDGATEPWALRPGDLPWYGAAAEFAVEALGPGQGRRCLVIGSPIFEAQALAELGWRITFVDIRRPPPTCPGEIWIADVMDLPFADSCYDAVSSTCVLCHVGIGRYGDPVAGPGADRRALAEIARVMKPGATAAIMFGPCIAGLAETIVLGRVHRIYGMEDPFEMAREVGLEPVQFGVALANGHWQRPGASADHTGDLLSRLVASPGIEAEPFDYQYLTVLLRKG